MPGLAGLDHLPDVFRLATLHVLDHARTRAGVGVQLPGHVMPAVYPVEWHPTTFRGDYPHFAKRDAPVWTRWLDLYADRFDAFAYDVALGGALAGDAVGSDAELRGWQYVTAIKLDAVGRTPTEAWLFEVRPEATVSAVGSVICYEAVAKRDSVFPRELVKAIVCESMQVDVKYVCQLLDIRVFYV